MEPLDERDITELITANREGATAVSLAAAPGLSLTSVKRLLRCPPDVIYPTSYEGSADRDASIALQSRRHRAHSGMCGRRPYAARRMRIVALFHSGKGKDSHTRKTWMPSS